VSGPPRRIRPFLDRLRRRGGGSTRAAVAGDHAFMVEIGIGLGSNIGDKAGNVLRAVAEMQASGEVRDLALSSLYRTAPWGNVEQDWFVNACAVARTALPPERLLALFQACEARMGRERIIHWGPRNIDIDLLYYDGIDRRDPDLTLPHPEMLNRAFVLVPLMELRPGLIIDGVPIADALAKLDATDIARLEQA
jgi:2-amino-4-hydroxy-6-hydroxymethyldihydropteridine diphosphokinase